MAEGNSPRKRIRRKPRPLGPARLEELALAYVARFATTGAKLRSYLQRKVRERGWEGEEEGAAPDLDALVSRFADKGYVDDAVYARARSGDLLRRGYGARRVSQQLMQAGVGEELREEVAPGEQARREAVCALARKRRFGPFDMATADGDEAHKRREKQLAAMVRAGHDFEAARRVLDARSEAELQTWVDEAREDEF